MRNWKDLFGPSTVSRAEEYVQKDKVKGLVHSKTSCLAKVLDQKICNVKIDHLDHVVPDMTCTCETGRAGKRCVHEAAVLCALFGSSADTEEPLKKESEAYLIDTTKSIASLNDPNMYFQIGSILKNVHYEALAREEAKILLDDNEVVLDTFHTAYSDDPDYNGQYGIVEGYYVSGGIHRVIRLVFTKDCLLQASCNNCYNRYNHYDDGDVYYVDRLCPHEAALLELSLRFFRQSNPGDETNYDGAALMDSFASYGKTLEEEHGLEEERIKDVTIVPRLTRDIGGQLYVSFKAGNERLYILKNPSQFLSSYEKRKTVKLGKQGVIHFESEDVTVESEKWIGFFRNRQLEQDKLARVIGGSDRYYNNYVPQVFKQSMELSGATLDEFYQLANPSTLEYIDKVSPDGIAISPGKKGILHVEDRAPHLALTVQSAGEDARGLKGIRISGNLPMTFKGGKGLYILDKDSFSVVDPERSGDLMPILDAGRNGQANFLIGRKNISEFYYHILPALRDNDSIEITEPDQERIEKVLPPDSHYTFYLDLEQKQLLMHIVVRYGAKEYRFPQDGDQLAKLPYRAISSEERVFRKARELFPSYNSRTGDYVKEATDDAIYDLLAHGVHDLEHLGDVRISDDLQHVHIRRNPQVSIGVRIKSGLMDLSISTHDMTNAELLELLESYRKKKRYHRLKNGDFVEMEQDDSLDMLEQIVNSSGADVRDFTKGEMKLPLYRALYLNKLLEEHDDVAADRDRNFKNLVRSFKTIEDSDFEVPSSLDHTMRRYQKFGYKWIRTLADAGFGGILADEMGLGKTLQMISVLLAEKEEGNEGISLVVCPASLVYNWVEEFQRFAPTLNVVAVSGTVKEREILLSKEREQPHADVLVTSYDLLKRDIKLYQDFSFSYMILDEAQYIKNPRAAAAKSVKIIRASHRFALTGTPIENRLSELWSIFDFLMPGFLYSYPEFREDLETPITKNQDKEVTERLKRMISPFILRRFKKDVLKDLPDKIEEARYAAFEPKQRRIYDAQVVHMKEMLEKSDDHSGKDKLAILGELTKIREICCDPHLVLDNYDGPSAKLDAFMDLVESAIGEGHRILVFSAFKSMLEILETALKAKKISYYKIVGDTKKEERVRLVHNFNHGDVPVFLISLKAGGTGLNLTGADVVIHYDPWWNLAAQNQATDRAHRIGQTKRVSVYRLVVKDTIEEKIIQMQEKKKELADAVLSGETTSLGVMSKEELLELLS